MKENSGCIASVAARSFPGYEELSIDGVDSLRGVGRMMSYHRALLHAPSFIRYPRNQVDSEFLPIWCRHWVSSSSIAAGLIHFVTTQFTVTHSTAVASWRPCWCPRGKAQARPYNLG
jgi:hypothetical protein